MPALPSTLKKPPKFAPTKSPNVPIPRVPPPTQHRSTLQAVDTTAPQWGPPPLSPRPRNRRFIGAASCPILDKPPALQRRPDFQDSTRLFLEPPPVPPRPGNRRFIDTVNVPIPNEPPPMRRRPNFQAVPLLPGQPSVPASPVYSRFDDLADSPIPQAPSPTKRRPASQEVAPLSGLPPPSPPFLPPFSPREGNRRLTDAANSPIPQENRGFNDAANSPFSQGNRRFSDAASSPFSQENRTFNDAANSPYSQGSSTFNDAANSPFPQGNRTISDAATSPSAQGNRTISDAATSPSAQGKRSFIDAANSPIAEALPSKPRRSSTQSTDYYAEGSPLRPPTPMPPPPPSPSPQRRALFPDDGAHISRKQIPPLTSQQGRQQNLNARKVPFMEGLNLPVSNDDTFTSNRVFSLNSTNFTKFLNRMDVTLVVFYDKGSQLIKDLEPVISQAACSTKRSNHAYAGVDCKRNAQLCKLNDATRLPMLRLYTKTACVGQMQKILTLTPEILRQYVESG